MSESRRGFLAKIFGGTLVAAAGGAIKVTEAKEDFDEAAAVKAVNDYTGKMVKDRTPDIFREVGPYELESTEFASETVKLDPSAPPFTKWAPPHIVLNDFKPATTGIYINDAKIAFVDRVYAWWPNQGDKPWVGMRIVIPVKGFNHNAMMAKIKGEIPNVVFGPCKATSAFPVFLQHPTKEEPLHVNVMSLERDEHELQRVFACENGRVSFNQPVPEIKFMRCSRCDHYERMLTEDQRKGQPADGWVVNVGEPGSYSKMCPRCSCRDRKEVVINEKSHPYKLAMDCESTWMSWYREDASPDAPRVRHFGWPQGFNPHNTAAWLPKDKIPQARIFPEPNYQDALSRFLTFGQPWVV